MTQDFYNIFPLSDGSFRDNNSVLGREDIQVKPENLVGKNILDCGCGPGNVSVYIASSIKNAHLVSMDISKNSVKILKERLKKIKKKSKTNQIVGNILNFGFNKEYFDFIIVSGVVHHTPRPFKALENLSSMLKKGGKMYLSVYNKHSFYFPEFKTVGQLFRALHKHKINILLNVFIRIFQLALSIISDEKIPKEQAKRIFADRYLTPVASFHTNKQITKWLKGNGFRIIKNGTVKLGTLVWFLVEKTN